MSRFTPQFLDELRARTTLSALVGGTVKLQRAGREWRACCPFHPEKTPSFYVNDDKGFYHCFGCSAHGDVIRWMTDARGLSFPDAVKELADAAGVALPAPDPQAARRAERAATLYDVMAAAQGWFAEQLALSTEAQAYLKRRGIGRDLAARFGLGWAPDRRDALKTALARFDQALLVEAGLLIRVDDKPPYDRFRGRLTIPIRDARGRVIAFGGRIVGEGEPKYLNSPDTPLFDKGRTLYNLDRASAAARKAGRLIVVEGYLDVIALAKAGIDEAVAPLGTALTEAQLELLWRHIDVPVLCLDGDAAGRKAAVRAAERALPLLAPGRSLAIALLPGGRDPDDLVRGEGRGAVEAVVEAARPLADFLWQHEHDALPLRTPEARAGLKQRLAQRVGEIVDVEVRRHYAHDFRQRYDQAFFARAAPISFARGRAAPPRPTGGRARALGAAGVDAAVLRSLFAGLLAYPQALSGCAEALGSVVVEEPDLAALRDVLLHAAFDAAPLESGALIATCETAGLTPVVRTLLRADGRPKPIYSAVSGTVPEAAEGRLRAALLHIAGHAEARAALTHATRGQQREPDGDGLEQQAFLVKEADPAFAAFQAGDGQD